MQFNGQKVNPTSYFMKKQLQLNRSGPGEGEAFCIDLLDSPFGEQVYDEIFPKKSVSAVLNRSAMLTSTESFRRGRRLG